MTSNNQTQGWKSEVQSLFSTSSTLASDPEPQDKATFTARRYYYVLHRVI